MFRRATVAYRFGGVMGRFLFTVVPVACSVLGWMCVGMTAGSAFILDKRLQDPVRYSGPQVSRSGRASRAMLTLLSTGHQDRKAPAVSSLSVHLC